MSEFSFSRTIDLWFNFFTIFWLFEKENGDESPHSKRLLMVRRLLVSRILSFQLRVPRFSSNCLMINFDTRPACSQRHQFRLLSKRVFSIIFLCLSTVCMAESPIPIIFDTDIDTDCDDVGAVACLHAMADADEVNILATTVSSNFQYSAPCLDALNAFYGRESIPLGVPKRDGASVDRGSRYAKQIAQRFPSRFKTNDDAPAAVAVLRKVLADADDDSVRLVTVGYLTNVADLLRSSADEQCPLTGSELARRKVSHFVVMGGRYPEHLDPGKFGNFKPDPESAVYVTKHWPGTIYFSGQGEKIGTGRGRDGLPEIHPLRVAYDLFLGKTATRSSWDQVALLFAVRPQAEYWSIRSDGGNHIFPNGTNRWVDEDPADHRLVEFSDQHKPTIETEIERLMMQ